MQGPHHQLGQTGSDCTAPIHVLDALNQLYRFSNPTRAATEPSNTPSRQRSHHEYYDETQHRNTVRIVSLQTHQVTTYPPILDRDPQNFTTSKHGVSGRDVRQNGRNVRGSPNTATSRTRSHRVHAINVFRILDTMIRSAALCCTRAQMNGPVFDSNHSLSKDQDLSQYLCLRLVLTREQTVSSHAASAVQP